jgi:threonine synthase
VAVSDEKILEAQRILAKTEGIFAEPSGVTSLAGLIKLAKSGGVERSDTIVVEITGSGLKDPKIGIRGNLDIPVINPSLDELERILRT